LHDAVAGDRFAVPSVGIMTTRFVSAAELMARVLGANDYRFAVIDHPISSATPSMLEERALLAAKEAHEILTAATTQ